MLSLRESTVETEPPSRTALLVFARSVTMELEARQWPRRFAPLFERAHRACANLDTHFFTDRAPENITAESNVHRQIGRDFSERLRHAVATLAARGYEHLIVVGGDCPDLAAEDIAGAAALLSQSDAVLGPDHRGGMYLIGLHARDRHLLETVTWQRHTDLHQLQALFAGRAVVLLPVKIDLDCWSDLQLFAHSHQGGLQRWLARELACLAAAWNRTGESWVDLARQAAQARRLTSPPDLSAL